MSEPDEATASAMCSVTANPWDALRHFTDARIALGRAGSSLPTAPLLAFNLAHAQARDAVHQPLDAQALRRALDDKGFEAFDICSAASNREQYLRRPDLGRVLSDASVANLSRGKSLMEKERSPDVVFVIADGLSANAASCHAIPLIEKDNGAASRLAHRADRYRASGASGDRRSNRRDPRGRSRGGIDRRATGPEFTRQPRDLCDVPPQDRSE